MVNVINLITICLMCLCGTHSRKVVNSFTYGNASIYQVELYRSTHVTDGKSFLRAHWKPRVPSYGRPEYVKITQYTIIQYNPYESSSKIITGGLGEGHIEFDFKTAWFRGFDVELIVYGEIIRECDTIWTGPVSKPPEDRVWPLNENHQ